MPTSHRAANVHVRGLEDNDRPAAAAMFREAWGATHVVRLGHRFDLLELPGFAAIRPNGTICGLLVYAIGSQALEVVSIQSSGQPSGIGTKLLAAAVDTARSAGCTRVWLVTTNDNGPALRFYRRRGFVLTAVHRDAVAADRALKPEIPALGRGGIAIRDYLELEYRLP